MKHIFFVCLFASMLMSNNVLGQNQQSSQSTLGLNTSQVDNKLEIIFMPAKHWEESPVFLDGLFWGDGPPEDEKEWAKYYRVAAQKGDADAQFKLGWIYDTGHYVPEDNIEAVRWYRTAAEHGHSFASFNLGVKYSIGEGVPLNYKEAAKWYRIAAEQRSATAQYNLGWMYTTGEGVPQDYKEAVKWYRLAAEQGDIYAQFNLGGIYANGLGVIEDDKEAIRWYRMATEQGNVDTQFQLGFIYSEGVGLPQDYKEAVKWFRMSAEQGNATAQFNLGLMYYNGEGVPRDFTETVKWFTLAAEQRYAPAQLNLGFMYDNGKGVPLNYKEAAKWYRMASEQGHPGAQFNLGLKYAKGEGVIEDYVEAYKWLLLSGMNGEDVINQKALLQEKMSTTQIAESQRLAKEFVAQKNRSSNETPGPIKQGEDTIKGFGTGFFISQNGYFVTAAHVVQGVSSVKIFWQSKDYLAEIILVDKTLDMAILKVIGVLSPQALPLSSSVQVKTGDTVFTMGFPQIQLQGIEPKYTDGSISSLSGVANDPKHFQISVPVQPGNSGGPLLNNQGQVVGLIISRLDDLATLNITGSIPQNVNYALKGSFILPLLESLPDIQLKSPATTGKSEAIEKAKNAVALVVCYE